MEIIGGFFMPSINMEDNMKKKQIDLVQFTPEMNEEQILEKLEQYLCKQGWTIIEDEEVEEKDNG
tara:strand:- start:28 stop:222 length:195 start_codon:yes stop_codon:yes gene_type:complete